MVAHALLATPGHVAYAALKAVLLITVGVLGLRLGKPRMLGRLAAIDIITLAAMGAAIGRTATAKSASFSEGAAVVVSLVIVHRLFSVLRRFGWFQRLTDRPAEAVVNNGVIDTAALARSGMTVNDLHVALRRQGITNIDDVAQAVHESTGELSVIRAGSAPPPSSDL